ncbi:S8 family serine peptidase [uncultured Winogradskyella sp.]|uniref:S8 family peptidase n=1 Tax=uncultured Winogradskyella sp. TaxID=395353 RepID=UPI002636A095|nr:S8 family serine peptidase [uncultured Winogradskyella sp.]
MQKNPDFNKMWGLSNTGQSVAGSVGTNGIDINILPAWEITRGNKNVVVAIIDSGVDYNHPDLISNIMVSKDKARDFLGEDSISEDRGAHGTHIAGIIAAAGNKKGMIGVAPQILLLPVRVDLWKEDSLLRAEAINYITHCAINDPERNYIINCSWKMSAHCKHVHDAICNAIDKNLLVISGAGNENSNIDESLFYPAAYPEVISVAAIDQNGKKGQFSNYGKTVDVVAPGVHIFSTHINNGYKFNDGTSMAAAYVSGVSALIWSKNTCLSNIEVRALLENNCKSIDKYNQEYIGLLGHGLVDAYMSLTHIHQFKTV